MLKQKKVSFFIDRDKQNSNNDLLEFGKSIQKNKIINSSEPDEILSAIGVSIDLQLQKNFSFKQIEKNQEAISNPNIIEQQDYKKFNNNYDKPEDKFPNQNDPFYQLDDLRDENEKQISNQIPNTLKPSLDRIADDVLKININKKNTIKQFRSQN
jgi:hypothetical protein